MYLILSSANLIASVATFAQYVRKQDNGVIIGCKEPEAEAIYSGGSDTFYPIRQIGCTGEAYALLEVASVPANVVAGYYYYHAGEFYTTAAKQAEMQWATAQKDILPVASLVFVTLAESGQVDETTALEHPAQFAAWAFPIAYVPKQIRSYKDKLYRCVQGHASQADWTPDLTPALWTLVGNPAEEWPAWSQPIGAHDAYALGAKVCHKNQRWTSSADSNVWEPGVYGWTVTK